MANIVPLITLRASSERNLRILQEMAEFWKIPYSTKSGATNDTIVFSSGPIARETEWNIPRIISPSSLDEARSIARRLDLRVDSRETTVRMPVSKNVYTGIKTTVHEFTGPGLTPLLSSDSVVLLSRVRDNRTYLLAVDIASDYHLRVHSGLYDPPSLRFRLATRLPFSYNTIPSFMRKRTFRTNLRPDDLTAEKIGPVECLRTVFLASLSKVAQRPIPRLWFWRRGKTHAVVATHDVETRAGLKLGTRQLLQVEAKIGIRSTWNIPSTRYPITPDDLTPLAKAGEIGGHDTTHDGRLVLLNPTKMVERLRDCRLGLEEKGHVKVSGFRSPLLQHSRELLSATSRAGFTFDSSVPSWELLSPTSFKPHGVGTVFPFPVDGTLEIPVTLPQDHQLVRAMGLKPSEAVERWRELSSWIKRVGGVCVLLVHPDYEFALPEFMSEYEMILRILFETGSDHMTMGQLAEWWRLRSSVKLEVSDGEVKIKPESFDRTPENLEVQLVNSYGEDGFAVERLN